MSNVPASILEYNYTSTDPALSQHQFNIAGTVSSTTAGSAAGTCISSQPLPGCDISPLAAFRTGCSGRASEFTEAVSSLLNQALTQAQMLSGRPQVRHADSVTESGADSPGLEKVGRVHRSGSQSFKHFYCRTPSLLLCGWVRSESLQFRHSSCLCSERGESGWP